MECLVVKNKIFAVLGSLALFALTWTFVPPPRHAAAQFVDQSTFGGNSGGTANAQTITIANYTAHTSGVVLRFVPGSTNTGPMQINVSGLGLVNVTRPSSIGVTGLSGGEVQSGELTCITYNGSTYQLACNVDMTPIGKTIDFRGATAPRGSLIEDGSAVSRTTYASLFSVIGTTYGAGDGSTTFNVPDSRGAMFAALDNQGANGAANRITNAGSGCTATAVGLCGSQNQTFARNNLPNTSVSVTITDPGHTHTNNANSVNSSSSTGGGAFAISAPNAATINSATTGISAAFNLNGNVSQVPVTTLPPVSLGRRAIKY